MAASGQKPTLRERLRALEDRHATGELVRTEDDQQADAALATPPATMEEAAATLEAGLGVKWSREFATHSLPDGSTVYVDTHTGQTYDTLPAMHDKDGHDT